MGKLPPPRAAALVVVFVLGPIVVLALASGYASITGAAVTANALTQTLQALVGGPVIVLVLVVAIGVRYGTEIGGVLTRISRLWVPGAGFEATQPTPEAPKPAEPGGEVETTPASTQQLTSVPQVLLQQQRLRVYWYMHYLNLFLVPMTQGVLAWLAQASREVSWQEYETAWSPQIPEAARATTIDALARHYLIEQNGGLIGVTLWGHKFLAFRAGTWRPLRDYPGDNQPLE